MTKTHFWLYFLTIVGLVFSTENSIAQQTYQPSDRPPVADNTLIGTQVSNNGNGNFDITGGLSRGQTLLHSFQDFSVPTGGAANFANPAGIRDMISRVTGGSVSDINGRINSNGANFFLINPNGIVFGPNAQLNVGRAFMASTANGINLVDAGGRAITFGTNPNGDAPLLTIAPNVFFNVSSLNLGGRNGQISNFGTLQTNNPNQYIGLIGGNVTLDGKYGEGKIVAPGGRVDLGGLNSTGTVTANEQGLIFGSDNLLRSDVSLINGGAVSIRADGTISNINTFFGGTNLSGSGINISANNINFINDSSTLNKTQSNLESGLKENIVNTTNPAGDININATGKVTLDYGGIYNTLLPGAEGKLGDIKISTNSLDLKNQSTISSITLGTGNAGNIDIKTKGNFTISGTENFSLIQQPDEAAPALSSINSNTKGQGDAGKITINTAGKLSVLNKGGIFSAITPTGLGNSNGIKIDAGELEIANRSTIQTATLQSQQVKDKGNAGDIDIKTNGNLTIIGTNNSSDLGVSAISSSTGGQGNAGKITINTQGNKLLLSNRAGILSAIASGVQGNSQGINIDTGDLNLNNGSYILTSNIKAQGNVGNIVIISKGNMDIVDSSAISSENSGQGKAGNISITSKKLTLNKESLIITTSFSASGGDLQLDLSNLLLLRNNSFITTNSGSSGKDGNGGNITIGSPLIIATPGKNDITANAYAGNGGKVTIKSDGLFNIKYRPKGQESEFTNDITASSTFGQSGNVNISTPGTDPGKDSTTLPTVPTDASNQIAQTCSASNRQNKLTVAGRGGLPPNANDPLTSDVVWQDTRATNSQPAVSSTTTNPVKLPPPAVGWVFDGKGKVTLIAAATEGQPTGTSVTCPQEREQFRIRD
jgi:filamentous hemagglutinin family protein